MNEDNTYNCKECTYYNNGDGSIRCEYCDPPFTSQFKEKEE